GAEGLAFDNGDAAVAELGEVLNGEAGGAIMIEDNVGDTRQIAVAGDGYHRNGHSFLAHGVNGDQAFHGSLLEETRIFLDQIVAVAMADDERRITFLEKG